MNAGNKDVVSIYPNPFTTIVTIQLKNDLQLKQYQFKLFNILGVEVMSTYITKQSSSLETSNLPSGIYFYKVIGNNKTVQSGRLVSQK